MRPSAVVRELKIAADACSSVDPPPSESELQQLAEVSVEIIEALVAAGVWCRHERLNGLGICTHCRKLAITPVAAGGETGGCLRHVAVTLWHARRLPFRVCGRAVFHASTRFKYLRRWSLTDV